VKRLLTEPLLHFLVLGGLMFAGHGLLGRDREAAPGRIVVSQGQLASMMVGFTRTWHRPPTTGEWEALIQDRVREEVYSREALAMGLDRDDTIIRRRLRQKMEFISEDLAHPAPPSEAELAAYLAAHPDTFRAERRFTFTHVFLDPGKRGENLGRDAARLLVELNRAGARDEVLAQGDPFLLEHEFVGVPAGEVDEQFGKGFAAKLAEVPPGRWQGPVESGYGMHLVSVGAHTPGPPVALADVRDAVRREWDSARRKDANERFYQDLLQRYTVTVESLEPGEDRKVATRQ
jgi:parvulin-like peptidyl-prolyl cis-trans isomerase-like protein